MPVIAQCHVAEDSLLRPYRGGKHPEGWGHYGDCFSVSVDRAVMLGEFVLAFYTSPVFRMERLILRILTGAASTDGEARALAEGRVESFAVWTVGGRPRGDGAWGMSRTFGVLLGLHRIYSRVLLAAARQRVMAM